MPITTVSQPEIGYKGYFTFKEPFARYIKNRFNRTDNKFYLEVTSVVTMDEMIKLNMQDPYILIYTQASISQQEYNQDLIDNVVILTFKYVSNGVDRYIKVPINYIDNYQYELEIEYTNTCLVLDLGMVYKELNIDFMFSDLKTFVKERIGIEPDIKSVSLGIIEDVSNNDHETRETIRTNNITVNKTTIAKLEELQLKYSEVLQRLSDLGISLN